MVVMSKVLTVKMVENSVIDLRKWDIYLDVLREVKVTFRGESEDVGNC